MLQNNSLNAKQGRIHLKDLCTTIKILSDQENTGFKEEYKEIPNGELHPCEVGKREENKVKNRYTTTFPYDHTRVTLQESNKNDGYINANYIRDLSGEKRYIATQGPKKKTIAEFWEMVWQETVTTIVCLTNLKEGTREKCRQYWPNNSAKIQHGHFAIRNNEEKNYANYVTRNFHVQNIDRKEERDVRMFHYTQWTDHGVPEALNLVMFHRHFLRSLSGNSLQHKIVVHCSAGIGRTGTFIALDALYRDGLSSGSVNVKEFVTQMRHDRMNMIQGEDQYKMVYAALYESFRGDLHPVDAETFLSQYQNSSCYVNLGEVANKKSPVEDQFKELKSLNPYHTVNNSVSGHANFGANFTEEDLPNQKYKCYVLSDDDKEVHYNNAVILQSFTKPDGIISAQYPNENQCEDFLYLVRKSGAGTSKCWFPSKNDTKVVGDFTVKMRICTPSDCVTKTNIIIQKKGFKDVAVSVLECNFWREDTVVADCRKVLNVITETRLIESTRPDSRTLVLSSDGAKRCGPFCVAYNAIEQLILDKEVDIFTTTRLIQIRRPDMISTIEEYQFCHDLIAEYLQNDTVYANYSN
ncbi:receptor-type tyrosine-protein phosphatase alpha-like [Saccostrea echinata]|uniref:receptor-type tyrosine-protein phosphatase alpha-like n=1 Tax=Saccostrea echinata TaxID=191078 RepID=UPI002A7EB4E3|nr:receptor-type tyrosine-protein phosphatase alpha-like [Saccostrea echinata]